MKILYRFLFTLMFHILSTRVIIPIMIKSIYQFSVNRIHNVGQAARRLNVNFNWIYHTSEIVQLLSHQIEVMTTLFECVSTKTHTHNSSFAIFEMFTLTNGIRGRTSHSISHSIISCSTC